MHVYGDAEVKLTQEEARTELDELRRRVQAAPRGAFARHAAAVEQLIFAGQLAQAALDRESGTKDEDDVTALARAAHRLLLALGAEVVATWDALEGGRGAADVAATSPPVEGRLARELFRALAATPGPLVLRAPEGYSQYALYPEAYLEAARRLRTEPSYLADAVPLVVGVRSIGTSLGAVVAAALGGTLVTVRPRGEPFARILRVSSALAEHLDPAARRTVLVVDEGPGISGSSFGAVADWFEDRGAPCVLCLPSHRGELGPVAAPRHRARWQRQPRPVVTPEELFAFGAHAPLHGDAWRARLCGEPSTWPPSHPQQERLKYLLRVGDQGYVAKHVGLGVSSEAKLSRARALGEAGFAPRAHELRHGMLLSDWHEDARPRRRGEPWSTRDVERLADYLLFRRRLPVPRRSSASPADLLEMTCANSVEALGAGRAEGLERLRRGSLSGELRCLPRIASDNRLQPWEWIDLPDGRLLKCDALDHAEGHDLVGPQSVAWDLAGAAEELDLDGSALERLVSRVWPGESLAFRAEHLLFFRAAYLAFTLGFAHFASNACANEEEAGRWSREHARYQTALGRLLDSL